VRILIADDEELVRFTIKDMICETNLVMTEIHEAANGRELIEQFRLNPPDLVLADIRMPGLSGLDAMEELKDEKAHWVFLTGHADFEYARKALQLGADNYLLKPPSKEELEKILTQIQFLLVKKRKEEQRLLEHSLNHIISGTSAFEYEPELQQNGFWSGYLIYLDSSRNEQESLEIRNNVSRHLREYFCSTEYGSTKAGIVSLESGCLFLCRLDKIRPKGEKEISSLLASVHSQDNNYHIIGIPGDIDFARFSQNWESIEKKGWQRFLSPPGAVLHIRDDMAGPVERFCRKLEEWITLNTDERETVITEDLERESIPAEVYEGVRQNLRALFPDSAGDTIASILRTIDHKKKPVALQSRSVLVDQAVRIIEEHFQEEIGIAQIAYRLEVTPNYLSSLFRKHSGIAFTKYITDIRIERARSLLKNTNLNIKEIASKVGYRSSRHFSVVFRQEEGVSPSEYIRSYRT
jgi:two-component system response regulator YesN